MSSLSKTLKIPSSCPGPPSMAQEEDTTSSLEAKFDAAVRVIRSLPEDGPYQPSDNMMLMFYSYYKQATLGPCNIPRPTGFWDSRGKAKWDAWSSLGNMTKEEAMLNYVDDIQLILETIPVSEEVSELVEKLGNFYAEVGGAGDQEEKNEVDKRDFTRPFAGCAGFGDLWEDIQNPGNDGEVWEEGRWSVSSMEPSVSFITNGIHSSLNSQRADQKLASVEPRAQRYIVNSDNSGVISEKKHRTTDSDNEEFCDSMEHLAMEEASGSRRSSARRREFAEEGLTTLKAREDVTHLGQPLLEYEFGTVRTQSSLSRRGRGCSRSPRTACVSQLCVTMDAACRCVSAGGHPGSVAMGNVHEQIATALLRLQEDMANVLHRLHTLEVLTVSQVKDSKKNS
ncbi:hypothetical protein NHX12_004933 [Muraenolepis orangiensis]|uniref:ACB domain-containing protein n=1 Tax=Muraenolepis orangiensis TaxID=630683 RepID=A0A9Q0IET3_9TELE|nr:hypothetical protein NHX12_004933 [Muraenolepis orangiensis]